MNLVYLAVGVISIALMAYLICALLKPEWFS